MLPPPLIDIGANLAHGSFDRDREAVIARGRGAGIAAIIVTGSTVEDSARAIALCRRHPGMLRATAGVHPHHAQGFRAGDEARLAELLDDPMTVAAGECGLDFYRNFSPPAEQRRAFERQLALAETRDRPLFLHQRDAHEEFIAMLREHPRLAGRAVLHCFTGGPAELEGCLALGLSIGVTGWICDERRGAPLREAAPHIPESRLMIETDAPYLLPRTLMSKPAHRRNEPAYLRLVLEELARRRDVDADSLASATTENACRFFGLTLGPSGLGRPRLPINLNILL